MACIIGARTNQILHLGVKNKYCFSCSRGDEVSSHMCFKNWMGTSTSMESEIILEGFKSLFEVHNLKMQKLLAMVTVARTEKLDVK